ncbi:L,D-transpeptidase family protein [Fusicatenibacter saccharivorans]|uniref:L,D-transpeptidase family protein n=1 Tax=Fusicatenibacter saccharivorans TaxID=1150298 RepID=UPI003F8A6BE7
MKRKVLAALLCGVLLGAAPVYAAENQSGETVSVSEDVSSDVSPEKGSENETPVVALTSGFQWITGSDGQAKLYYVTAGGSISRGNHTAYTRAEDTVSWLVVDGKWYLVDVSDGHLLSGWQTVDRNLYYFNPDTCAMETGNQTRGGWAMIDGQWYSFRSWGGMYSSTTVTIGGRQYTFDENGHKISVQSEWTKLASGLKAAKTHNQLIFVSASGTTATIAMVTRDADGTWSEDLCTSGYVGSAGVGETTEWNHRTPRGQFGFTYAFGILPNPGTKLSYTQVDDTYYWVDDVNSRYYNQFVTTKTTPKAWNSAEHIIEINPAYHYVLSLDYNPNCTPGVGSAIFLHCSTNRPTGGCISVPEDQMITVLKNVQPGCQIIIDSANGLKNY